MGNLMNNPIAYMYQHDETGRIGFVDPQQIEWGFEKANPRLHIVAPLYRNKWVPIEDSLPPDETPVLVMFRGQRRIAELRWLEPGREDDCGAYRYWDCPHNDGQEWGGPEDMLITHWMYLPDSPVV
jgi:hypothetical protein